MAIDVDGRLRSPRVIEVLSRLVSARGPPRRWRLTPKPPPDPIVMPTTTLSGIAWKPCPPWIGIAVRHHRNPHPAGDAAVDCRTGHRNGADRAGEAVAERRGGEIQRQVPRCLSRGADQAEPGVVPLARRGEGRDRAMAAALQRGAAAFEPALPDAGGVRGAGGEDSAP